MTSPWWVLMYSKCTVLFMSRQGCTFLKRAGKEGSEGLCTVFFSTGGSGNPRVTGEVTRDVVMLSHLMAANLYISQIEDLMFEVQHQTCDTPLYFISDRSVLYSSFQIPVILCGTSTSNCTVHNSEGIYCAGTSLEHRPGTKPHGRCTAHDCTGRLTVGPAYSESGPEQ